MNSSSLAKVLGTLFRDTCWPALPLSTGDIKEEEISKGKYNEAPHPAKSAKWTYTLPLYMEAQEQSLAHGLPTQDLPPEIQHEGASVNN